MTGGFCGDTGARLVRLVDPSGLGAWKASGAADEAVRKKAHGYAAHSDKGRGAPPQLGAADKDFPAIIEAPGAYVFQK